MKKKVIEVLPVDLIPKLLESATSDTTFELLLEIIELIVDIRKSEWHEFLDIKVLIMFELKDRDAFYRVHR